MTRIRVALLGTSFARLVQAPGFQRHPGFEVAAIAGSDAERTAKVAGELGIAAAYADWRELLARESPDLVSIVTPVDLHHPMMLASLAAGAHVHCEKPTALHLGQAVEMSRAARTAGRVAGINHEFRCFPARAYAVELVRAGAIGRPRRAEILGRYPIWHSASGRAMNWLADASRGGGILGALGSHHTDCLRMLFGEPVSAWGRVHVRQPRRGAAAPGGPEGVATADDACTFEYTFEGGATALVDLDATTPYRFERFEVHGEEASLRWDESGYRLWRLVPGADPEELAIPAAHAIERVDGDPALVAPFRVLVARWYRAITAGEPLSPSFEADAVPVQAALDAVRASSAAGAPVRVLRVSDYAAA